MNGSQTAALPLPHAPPRTGARRSVAFLVRSLHVGGAERQLALLAKGLHRRGHRVRVITFYPGGPFAEELGRAGVEVRCLEKGGRWDLARFGRRLLAELRRSEVDAVHSYLEVSNLLVALARPWLRPARIVWGLRASDLDLSDYHWSARGVFQMMRAASRLPDAVIVNSDAGASHHAAAGFDVRRMHVIPNAIDVSAFDRDPSARERQRRAWGIADDELLVGMVGRLDPAKDHETFLRAAAMLARDPRFRFICIGGGRADDAERLRRLAGQLDLDERLVWVGAFDRMPDAYNALDIICSSSKSEGFPNAIGEAMACGVPAVATDVGATALLVGDTGVVVPKQQPAPLAEGMREIAVRCRDQSLRDAARQRIAESFSVEQLLDRTEEVLWAVD